MSIETTDTSGGLTEEAAEAALMESLGAPSGDQNDNDEDDQDDDDQDDPDGDTSALDEIESPDEDDDDDGESQDEADEADEAEAAAAEISDDAKVLIEINGEAREFTVGSLKDLAGREETLAARSQEAELVGGRAAATLQAALELAQEDLAPYANVDWLVLQNQLDPAEFEWHRQNAGKAQQRFEKLVGAAQGFEQVVQQRKEQATARAAQECIRELTNPKTGIAGWNEQLYGDILTFGASQGLPQEDLAQITSPAVIKLLHKAMLFDRGQKVATKKVKQAPTKVTKGSAGTPAGTQKTISSKKALQRLSQSGSDDDAVAALVGRWG